MSDFTKRMCELYECACAKKTKKIRKSDDIERDDEGEVLDEVDDVEEGWSKEITADFKCHKCGKVSKITTTHMSGNKCPKCGGLLYALKNKEWDRPVADDDEEYDESIVYVKEGTIYKRRG